MNFYDLYLDMGRDNITLELEVLSQNIYWLNWLCTELLIERL